MPNRKRRKKRLKLSAEERKQRKLISDHKTLVRSVFRSSGFVRFPRLADREFSLGVTKSDFDDIYVRENIVLCIEYTVSSDVGTHLKKKKVVYDAIDNDGTGFISVLKNLDPEFREKIEKHYHEDEIVIRYIYCSRNNFDSKYKTEVSNPVFLDYPDLRYFKAITDCIKLSAFPELSQFLRISPQEIGSNGVLGDILSQEAFQGSVLPEANSNFDKGYKVVSFYASPEALLQRAYVLRKQGWRQTENPYQRMILKSKIDSIRRHLRSDKRVFVNNIVATLAEDTKILDDKGNTVDPSSLRKSEPVTVSLPARLNSVGLIDGQHRTFSYYAATPDDEEIKKLRTKQHLLVTGIIYPEGTRTSERERFEAKLFLEINSNQTNAKSDLKQAINLILEPFSDESIATKMLDVLDRGTGPLSGQFQRYWFDQNKLKTTSIVSYALKQLVKTSGDDSFFSVWDNPEKYKLKNGEDIALLGEYIAFCAPRIDDFLIAVRKSLPSGTWSPHKKDGGILTTTTVNCFLICLRLLIKEGLLNSQDYYLSRLEGLQTADLSGYHSSRYRLMAEALFSKYFATSDQ